MPGLLSHRMGYETPLEKTSCTQRCDHVWHSMKWFDTLRIGSEQTPYWSNGGSRFWQTIEALCLSHQKLVILWKTYLGNSLEAEESKVALTACTNVSRYWRTVQSLSTHLPCPFLPFSSVIPPQRGQPNLKAKLFNELLTQIRQTRWGAAWEQRLCSALLIFWVYQQTFSVKRARKHRPSLRRLSNQKEKFHRDCQSQENMDESQELMGTSLNWQVELQIGLKNYDPQRDKRFSGTIKSAHWSTTALAQCTDRFHWQTPPCPSPKNDCLHSCWCCRHWSCQVDRTWSVCLLVVVV